MFRYGVAAALIVSAAAAANSQGLLHRPPHSARALRLSPRRPTVLSGGNASPGQLSGYPDLSKDSCRQGDLRGDVRYWLCPAGLTVNRLTRGRRNQLAGPTAR